MPEEGIKKRKREEVMSIEEISEIVRAFAACGISKVRLTGGEPLLRSGIINICEKVANTDGIKEVCLTTNGLLVPQYAKELKAVGVNRLNFSLDSLDYVTYSKITRFDALDGALEGIRVALETGFDAIKVNAVLIGGVNSKDVLGLLELTRKHRINVRFIEIMPIGECADWAKSRFVSAQSVLQVAPELYEVGTDGVTKLFKLPGGSGTVGLISPISSHFCPKCNRIRVTSDGTLKPCLHSAEEINLRGINEAELETVIRNAIYGKPQKHDLDGKKHSCAVRNMNKIGG